MAFAQEKYIGQNKAATTLNSDGDEEVDKVYSPNPCDEADFWSYLLFLWPTPLIKLGAEKTLEQDDLYGISRHDDARQLCATLTRHYEDEKQRVRDYNKEKAKENNGTSTAKKQPSLVYPLIQTFWNMHWYTGILLLTETVARIWQALLLGMLINFFVGETEEQFPFNNGYYLSLFIVILGVYITFIHHHAFFFSWRLGLQMRMVLMSIIYDKAISLSLQSLSKVSVGHVVNLSSQDVEGFQLLGCFTHFIYQPILEAIAIIYLGIDAIGVSFIAGFSIIVLLIPLQKVVSMQVGKARRFTSTHTDERIRLVNQALSGARLMKINGWEHVLRELIESVRATESSGILVTNMMRGLNEAIFFAAPVLIGFLTFTTYVSLGGTLNTGKVFVVLTYFQITQMSMTKFFAFAVRILSCFLLLLYYHNDHDNINDNECI